MFKFNSGKLRKSIYKQFFFPSSQFSNPSNYRPIALICTLSKVFESVPNEKIRNHLISKNLFSDRQYGFLKGRFTGDLLPFLSNTWSSSLMDFGEIFVIALDISKACDRVWHKSLISKIPSFGLYSSLCNLLTSFLSGQSICLLYTSPSPRDS